MPPTYDYEIANLALARLGQGQIASLAAAGRDATICNLFYAQNRDWCLQQDGPWIEVVRSEHLGRGGSIGLTAITAAAPPVVTATGHLFVEGDVVEIEDCAGMTEVNSGTFVAKSVTSITFALYTTELVAVDGTAYSAYTGGGSAFLYHGNDWSYVYDLPSTCLRVRRLLDEELGSSESYTWVRIRDRLYTNLENAAVEYVHQETDVATYDPPLVDLMSARLAWLIAPRISNDESTRSILLKEWMMILADAQMTNADARVSDEPPESLWTGAR